MTEKKIRDARPGPKAAILWDSQVVGLGCKVFPTGRKAFVLSYRVDGKKRLATLGRPSELSLKAVREKAAAELVRIRDGESDPLQRRRELREAPTVADLLDRFFNEVVPRRVQMKRMSPKTVENYSSQARRYIRPLLGTYKVRRVTRADVEHVAAKVRGASQRNRTLQLLSRLFTEAERWEWRPEHSNPVRLVERSVEEPRDRTLSPLELMALAEALDGLEPAHPFAVAAIKAAAMTGMRIGEVLGMAWEHVQFETGRVILPDTKTGRRIQPLPRAVLELLGKLPRIAGNPWVFAGAKRGTAVGYKLTRDVFAKAVEGAGLADVRLHDLRRSLATRLAGAGVNSYILRDVLGHKTLAMSNRYVRQASHALAEAVEKGAALTAEAMEGRR